MAPRPVPLRRADGSTASALAVDDMEDIMTAAAAWDVAPIGVRSTRPTLRLVPTGPDAAHPAVRISRFGRLMLTVSAVVVLTVLAVTLLGLRAAGASIDHTVTVRPGQTLTEVAAVELPELPVPEGVAQIQLANDMNSSHVHAGQQLAIPVVG